MSTEARRASHPPRPTTPPSAPPATPPRPATPPHPVHPPRTAQDGTADPDRRRSVPRETSRTTSAEGPAADTAARDGSPDGHEPTGRTPYGSGAPHGASDRSGSAGRPPAGREDRTSDGDGPGRGAPRGAVPPGATSDGAPPPVRTTEGTGAFDAREPAREGGDADAGTTGPAGPAGPGRTSPSGATAGPRRAAGAGDAARSGTVTPAPSATPASSPVRPRFPDLGAAVPAGTDPMAPPPPRASARFPDAPPTAGRGVRPAGTSRPDGSTAVPRPSGHRPAGGRTITPPETPSEKTTRLRPIPADPASPAPGPAGRPPRPRTPGDRPGPGRPPAPDHPSAPGPGAPDPALSWSAPTAPPGPHGTGRPAVSFGEPEGYDGDARPRPLGRRGRPQAVAAAVCLVLGAGLIGGAATGSWLVGDSDGSGTRGDFAAAGDLWHNVRVDQLFPPTVPGRGAGPGGADRTWTRIAVAPDSGCAGAFDPLLRKVLAPVGCARLLRATYTDATQSHVTTVGLLFTEADAAGMASLARRFDRERLDRRTDLMPLPYAAKDTAAAGFGARQRASWTISVLTDAPVVVYAVSGWADGRTVDTPQPAEEAMESGVTTAPAQAGLGHEAQGLADRVERGVRGHAGTATERPS